MSEIHSDASKASKRYIIKKIKYEEFQSSDTYIVERVVKHVYNKEKRAYEFLVKWEGYPPSENSWVDEENITYLPVMTFWKQIGFKAPREYMFNFLDYKEVNPCNGEENKETTPDPAPPVKSIKCVKPKSGTKKTMKRIKVDAVVEGGTSSSHQPSQPPSEKKMLRIKLIRKPK